ncbi:NifU family protein [Micrococcus sp.]|uniref:NifU family protein n=1 Tax=Micrococcus sp. TaxID=1271 RepID=UPI002A914359|nr:NifU family protein [Micrococcus sp.]MDY6054934.1 NifU family protein [Micrococcus sp.]
MTGRVRSRAAETGPVGEPVPTAAVPTHPEAVPGDPATLRWAVPAGLLGRVGPVEMSGPAGAGPAPLEALREDGTVRAVVAEPAALRLTLGPGRTWRAEGARVRAALQESLALLAAGRASLTPEATADVVPGEGTPGRGMPVGVGGADPDAVLRAAAVQVLDGAAGEYLRSHGGTARLVDARDGEVVLELGGTCHACPARGFTLQMRLEAELRQLVPTLRSLRTL